MIDLSALPTVIILPACFLGGLLVGYCYFYALQKTADLIVTQGHPLLGLALTLGRLFILGAGLYLAVLGGAATLLAAFAGVISAKAIMLRQLKRTPA